MRHARRPANFLGALSSLSAAELGQVAVRAAVERSGINATDISELVLGNVVSAGVGQALPRQVSFGAGLPESVGGVSVNKVCGSGLKAVMLASAMIRAEDGDLLRGGRRREHEPRALPRRHPPHGAQVRARSTARLAAKRRACGARSAIGAWATPPNSSPASSSVTREEMDELAYRSHMNAAAATESGKFDAEIAPVTIASRKGEIVVKHDEGIRPDTSLEALAKLPAAFEQDGSVTAGNAPGMNDGAAALVVASRDYAEAARAYAAGADRRLRSGGGRAVVDFLRARQGDPGGAGARGLVDGDVDLFEVNEAFAAQVMADVKGLEARRLSTCRWRS